MTFTFVSNYINHHQIPFSDACSRELGDGYRFVQTQRMEEERLAMGWNVDGERLSYVRRMDREEEQCRRLIRESDVVLFGWTGREDLVEQRLKSGKLTLRVSERLYREGQWKAVSPRGLLQKYKEHTRYRNKPVCLLCAGAYVASDFHLIGAYPGKMLRFGYFPETIRYTEEELRALKPDDGTVQLVWAGRFLPLKHPEFAVRIAGELAAEGFSFHIHMAGGGELEEKLKRMTAEQGLEHCFTFYGYTKPEKVRRIMERCHIHLFTSNHLEGWGAVVNEAMNSGCCVVGSVEAGAVPFLLRHGENGLIYDGSYEDFAVQVKRLCRDKGLRERLGREAYRTITESWNAEHAAKELLRFCGELKKGHIVPAKSGPLSPAPVVPPRRMYRNVCPREKI